MTEVVLAAPEPHRHTRSVSTYLAAPMASRMPTIEMHRNPDFSFPMMPEPPTEQQEPRRMTNTHMRPSSAHLAQAGPAEPRTSHRRAVSTLPSFSFNANDSSGRTEEDATPPRTPEEPLATTTPSRRGHRRGASEFVGGDSRFGVAEAISTSPTKVTAPPMPSPSSGPRPGRRGHAHRRSAAMSSHDVSTFMHPSEAIPRLSSSLPNTPAEQPQEIEFSDRPDTAPFVQPALFDPFGPPLEELEARPPSRPRVEFSDNVEYIPRPLSTISSETEGSLSTVRGHSVNNSISSVLSLSTPSPPSARALNPSLSTTFEVEPHAKAKSSIELNRRTQSVEDSPSAPSALSMADTDRQASDTGHPSPAISSNPSESPIHVKDPRTPHRKNYSISHALGFDRRRSEPLINSRGEEMTRLSAISLPGPAMPDGSTPQGDHEPNERRLSSRRLKAWAVAKMTRKSRSSNTAVSVPPPADEPVPGTPTEPEVEWEGEPATELATAETNLDMVFAAQADADDQPRLGTPLQGRIEFNQPGFSSHGSHYDSDDDSSPVLDLDAALGPFKTPAMAYHRQRKDLHSNRLTKDFSGPGGHYHRRAESAPALAPFESPARKQGPTMADVFEEDEDEAAADTSRAQPDEESGVGISVVDSVSPSHTAALDWGVDEVTPSSRRFNTVAEPRAASIVEETIMEEGPQSDSIEIVQSHEEPRAASLNKSSSDSSEAPTIMDVRTGGLEPRTSARSLTAPQFWPHSNASTPDYIRRQESFDTPRIGTSASSIADNRTVSSYATGEHGTDQRVSVDDVPSLTSSRSTMMSTAYANQQNNTSRRELGPERRGFAQSRLLDEDAASEKRRKRSSIQSLSQLVGGSFGPRAKTLDSASRPQTAVDVSPKTSRKKEHRLKKLMFWKNMSKQSLQSHDT